MILTHRIFTLKMNMIFTLGLEIKRKVDSCTINAQFEFATHYTLIACFISYKKWENILRISLTTIRLHQVI